LWVARFPGALPPATLLIPSGVTHHMSPEPRWQRGAAPLPVSELIAAPPHCATLAAFFLSYK
jgi:hypothetical protein